MTLIPALPVAHYLARLLHAGLLVGALAYSTLAFPFVISDIRVEGLQRISAGTVFGAIPYNVGDDIGVLEIRQIGRSLFANGSFDDVQIGKDGNVLVIIVKERPTIDSIEFEGNKAIKTEALIEGLNESGLAEGQIFQKVTLEQIASDLERQYVTQGRYDANIETHLEELPRNRVAIKVEVYEGNVSGIQHINIVGNKVFDDATLIELLELKLPSFLSFYTKDDQYSREKLKGDLEAIESYYLDRGYLNFTIDSTQVAIASNMEDIYITVNVIEGEQFTIGDIEVVGDLHDIPEASIRAILITRQGQVFSREYMVASEENIERALGNAGYTFVSATGEPVMEDPDGDKVTVRYFVDTGRRTYVRRVNFRGNTVTQDEVLRRELRQAEGGWASTSFIEASKIRLERLGYFTEVNVETPAVPGTDDQIDVNYTVEEQPSGSISATLGYAQQIGLILGLSYQERNVIGSGNSLTVGINRSDYQKALNVSYFNPYHTIDGVSRGYSVFYQESDFDQRNIVSFSTDSYGASVNYGYPISEVSRINFGVGIESTDITTGIFSAEEISEFVKREGESFALVTLTAGYSMSALNRGLLATAGRSQSLSLEVTTPGSELEFYKINYRGQRFFSLFNPWVLRLRVDLGYGDTYGDTVTYPFYKNFYAGGVGSVRGYKRSSLGPQATPLNPSQLNDTNSIGGNVLVELSAEIIFPLPFIEDQRQIRAALFVDAGNVFNTNCLEVSSICNDLDFGDMRYSAGLAITWITGLAPISLIFSYPLNEKPGDEVERFQFELGGVF